MGILQDVAAAERTGVITRGMASALVRSTSERAGAADGPKNPEDVPPATEPGPEEKPAKKKTKGKGKKAKETHKALMASSPSYARAFRETRALHDASAPISARTREGLQQKAKVDAFAPGGLLGNAGRGHANGGDIKRLSSEDAAALRMGFPSHEGYLAARAIVGLPNRGEHVITSAMPARLGLADGRDAIRAPSLQSLEESQRELATAKQKAGVR